MDPSERDVDRRDKWFLLILETTRVKVCQMLHAMDNKTCPILSLSQILPVHEAPPNGSRFRLLALVSIKVAYLDVLFIVV